MKDLPHAWLSPRFHVAIVAAAVVAAYAAGLRAPFTFDDQRCIVRSPIDHGFYYLASPSQAASLPPDLQCAFPGRYVGHLTLAVNYRLGVLDPLGYHLFNVAVHLGSALLLYLLVTLAFRAPALLGIGERRLPAPLVALFAALLFACHPLQTQAVTYVVQRFASLAALFYLLAAVLYLRFRLPGPAVGRGAAYAGALGATALAMFTKENALTLPLALALLEATLLRGSWTRRLLGLAPFLLVCLVIPWRMGVFESAGSLATVDAAIGSASPVGRREYLLTQFPVVATYLRLFLLPVGQSVDHDFPIYRSLLDGPVLLALLLHLFLAGGSVVLLWRARRPGPGSRPELCLVSLGVLWFFLTLSVESSLVPLADVIFEHRAYLPSAGLCLAASTLSFLARRGLEGTRPAAARLVVPALSAVVLVLGAATVARNRVWSDEIRLWEDAARKGPGKVRPHLHLGALYAASGQLDRAAREIETAISLRPDSPEAYNSLGVILRRQGRVDAAMESYRSALRLRPDFAEARHNAALLYAAQGLLGDAIREMEEAVRSRPDYAEGHNALGVLYARQGRLAEAAREFSRTLEIDPGNAKARANLAQARATLGQ
ncbi:MAG TPA: tetratricopeptide repeat protein [Anaeromyxobacteraceae bacterium]|nr:tetratricopeptide repeat protein [Anaeromyxobacteraceae bacterium]